MAKKLRKKSAAKKKKKFMAPTKKKRKTVTKKKKARKSRAKDFTDKITGAYRTLIDTVKGTDRLRNKFEPPGTSETE